MTVDELIGRPPEVLGLKMNPAEVKAVLESARRRDLVCPLGHGVRADGSEAPAEWVLTSGGQRLTRGSLPWMLEYLRQARPAIQFAVGAGLIAVGARLLTKLNPSLLIVIIVGAVYLIGGLAFLGGFAWSRLNGSRLRDHAVKDWGRYQSDEADWYAKLSAPRPLLSLIGGVVALIAGIVIVEVVFPSGSESEWMFYVVGGIGFAFGYRYLEWRGRWDRVLKEAKERAETDSKKDTSDEPPPVGRTAATS